MLAFWTRVECASIPTDGFSNKRMMGPVAFVEAMIRMSRMKYRPEGLIRGINIFLDDLTRYAVQSNAKEFRHELTSDTFAHVIDRRCDDLIEIFEYWSKNGEMSLSHWTKFVTSLGLVGDKSRLGVKRIPEMFHAAQHHDDPHADGNTSQKRRKTEKVKDDGEFNDSHTESMSFGEFIEALATAILFILPDPYQPLGSKFEVYLLHKMNYEI